MKAARGSFADLCSHFDILKMYVARPIWCM
jgi:hypothetical protein